MLLVSQKRSSYSLLKFVYVTSQLRYSFVVHPLLREILDPPLLTGTYFRGYFITLTVIRGVLFSRFQWTTLKKDIKFLDLSVRNDSELA